MNITSLYPVNALSDKPIQWNLISDQVMGGLSQGQMQSSNEWVNMQGEVSLANNGGFLQLQTLIPKNINAGEYQGISVEICSQQPCQLQLLIKSSQLWMPWQSYRAQINATPDWQSFYVPFTDFAPYKTRTSLNPKRITKFAVLAGGSAMDVNVSIKQLGLYR